MDSKRAVDVSVLAGFRKIKQMTEDRAVIVSALRKCANCAVNVDGSSVTPSKAVKVERNTLILRE
jgi:hypothetical protein